MVQITRVDENNGNFRRAYEAIGSPPYPSLQQIEQLKQQCELPKPESARLNARSEITISIPPNGVALLELR
jgi:xylan 1,4-beta-xylosidase